MGSVTARQLELARAVREVSLTAGACVMLQMLAATGYIHDPMSRVFLPVRDIAHKVIRYVLSPVNDDDAMTRARIREIERVVSEHTMTMDSDEDELFMATGDDGLFKFEEEC